MINITREVKIQKRKRINAARTSAMDGLPINDEGAMESAEIYLSLSEEGLNKLEAFNPDGTVKFYYIGSFVLGKSALIQFVKSIKKR